MKIRVFENKPENWSVRFGMENGIAYVNYSDASKSLYYNSSRLGHRCQIEDSDIVLVPQTAHKALKMVKLDKVKEAVRSTRMEAFLKWVGEVIKELEKEPEEDKTIAKTQNFMIDKPHLDMSPAVGKKLPPVPGMESFEHPVFGEIRGGWIDGEPWFVGFDITNKLGYENGRDALRIHVDEEDKRTVSLASDNTTSMNHNATYIVAINESGLYSLIFGSKLPTAKEFKHWVTSEVLPTIRKTGAYMTKETIEKVMYNPKFIYELSKQLMDLTEKFEQEEQKRLAAEAEVVDLKNEQKEYDAAVLRYGDKAIANAIIRSIAARKNIPYSYVWNRFYKDLNLSMGISPKRRVTKGGSAVQRITEEEWPRCHEILRSLAHESGVPVAKVIHECNATRNGYLK